MVLRYLIATMNGRGYGQQSRRSVSVQSFSSLSGQRFRTGPFRYAASPSRYRTRSMLRRLGIGRTERAFNSARVASTPIRL